MPSTISPEAANILSGNTNATDTPQQNPKTVGTRAVNAVITPAPNVAQPQAPALPSLGPQQNGPTYGAAGASDYKGTDPRTAAQTAHTSRMAALGMLASKIFRGGHDEYSVGEDGKIASTFVPDKPGQIFRNLLGGALMGMAAGSAAHDFAGGAGLGAEAGMRYRQGQDQENYARATQAQAARQRQTEIDQRQQEIDQARKDREARIAQLNVENMRADANLNLQEQHWIEDRNDRETELQNHLEEMGAKQIVIPAGGRDVNGTPGNGAALQADINANGVQNLVPAGYHPVWTFSTDLSGLEFKGGQWVDEQTGDPVNLETRTTHRIYALPDNVWDQPSNVTTGKQALALTPHLGPWVSPDQKLRLTVGDTINLAMRDAQAANEQADARQRNASANRQNTVARNGGRGGRGGSNADEIRNLNQQRLIASSQLQQAAKSFNDQDYATARTKLDQIDAQLKKLQSGTVNPPPGKSVVYDPQGNAHFVDSSKVSAFLADPQYKGWHN